MPFTINNLGWSAMNIQDIEFIVGAFGTVICIGFSVGKQILALKQAAEIST